MPINHQNNFGTNLTSNQTAGVTTTPLNSIPSVSAPFYIALDATNTNGKYEVVYVTSKTATNINHAATTYAHTTAEEVRMVIPATEMNTLVTSPQGHMFNGKISPTVSSNNLTAAVKTLSGGDPSTTDPVWIRIGDTMRTITSALSVTAAAATNWFNSGGSELATKEVDYFAYLGYNATDGVVLGISRYPGARQYSDFSATSTNEKYCRISTITTAASTDYYEVVGRFAATLSAGAGYTWTVPTYTADNLIQQPIYETRWLDWVPTFTAGAGTPTTVTKTDNTYKVSMNNVFYKCDDTVTDKGTASSTMVITLPFTYVGAGYGGSINGRENGSTGKATCGYITSNTLVATLYDNTTIWVNTYRITVNSNYEI